MLVATDGATGHDSIELVSEQPLPRRYWGERTGVRSVLSNPLQGRYQTVRPLFNMYVRFVRAKTSSLPPSILSHLMAWHNPSIHLAALGHGFPVYLAADDMTVTTVVLLCIPGSSGGLSLQGTVRPFGPGHRGNRRYVQSSSKQRDCVKLGRGRYLRTRQCVYKEGTRTRETHHRTQTGQHCGAFHHR